MKKIILIIIIFSFLHCSDRESDNFHCNYSIDVNSLDYSVDYIENINSIISSTDTVLSKTYMIEKDSIRHGFSEMFWRSSDLNNNVIKASDEHFFEYNTDRTIENEYFIKNSKQPLVLATKLHYTYYKGILARVDYLKIDGKDTLLNHRKLYYNKDGKLYLEKINNLQTHESRTKKYESDNLVSVDIFRYDFSVEDTLLTKVNYYYRNNLLSKLKVYYKIRNLIETRSFFYDDEDKLVKTLDFQFTKGEQSKTNRHNFYEKRYEYDNMGRFTKIFTTSKNLNTIKKIIYPKNHHNLKIVHGFFDNMGYYAQLRLN